MSRSTLFMLALVAVGLGIAVYQLGNGPIRLWESALGVAVGWSFIGSGLVAWERRPENAIGPVMVLAGVARLGAELCLGSPQPFLYTAGHLLHAPHFLAVAYVLLTFPTGRLDTRGERWILVGAGLLVGPLPLAWLIVGGPREMRSVLQLTDAPAAAEVLIRFQYAFAAVLAGLVIAVLIQRWWQASRPLRIAIGPVLWAGAVGFAVLGLSFAGEELSAPSLNQVGAVLRDLFMAAVPIAFLVGLLRARLAYSAVADLVVQLGVTTAPGELRQALARALHDPTLTLAYRLSESGRYVDVDGRPVQLPGRDDERSVTFAQRDGQTIAALVHDSALAQDPLLVESVCAAAALALENERLQADLRARLDELRESRSRMVQAALAERRRIERNLHDGTQQRLVSVSMALGLGEAKLATDPAAAQGILADARDNLSTALGELRELSQGIHPGILTERGLAAALAELARGATLPVRVDMAVAGRLPEAVETTGYYVVSEALANVSKHSRATRAFVRVGTAGQHVLVEVEDNGVGGATERGGSGLRGLMDRVEALGGTLTVSSPPGKGTVLRADIPCG